MRKFYLRTKSGDIYFIHNNGNIERCDMPGMTPSGQWKLLGIETTAGKRLFVPFEKLAEWLAANTEPTFSFLYKNRHPKWTVRDFDHGAVRTWGNTKHHGISDLRLVGLANWVSRQEDRLQWEPC